MLRLAGGEHHFKRWFHVMKKYFFAFLLIVALTAEVYAAERELLLFQDIPVVTIASKKRQGITDTPMPVVVIEAKEIRLSGATNIPDLLRRVAGVDVLSVSVSDLNVSVRGFNMEASGKVLVMIDGRSVYLDFYGIVLWDALPISMDEIRQIELIKGPGSSIYGGNAFNGVVNIITKSPGEIDGGIFSLRGGEDDTFVGSALYGKRTGNSGYKLSVSRDETDEWDAAWNDGSTRYSTSGNFVVERHLSGRRKLSFSGSVDESKGETTNALDNFIRETRQSHLMMDYACKNDFNVKLFWNGINTTVTGESVLPFGMVNFPSIFDRDHYHIKTDIYQSEVTKLFKTEHAGSVLLGANYSLNKLDSFMIGGSHEQKLYSLFAEDEIAATEKMKATFGGRYDHHPLIGGKISPRLGVVYSVAEAHHLKLSYATAYHLPTFVNSYLKEPLSAGNKNLDEEKIKSWNVGYKGNYSDWLNLDLDGFYNEVEGFIRWPGTAAAPGTPYSNREDFEIWGGEVEAGIRFLDDFKLVLNYAYLHMRYEDGVNEGSFSEAPQSKVNLGVNYSGDKLEGSLFAHYVSETRWPRHLTSNTQAFYDYTETVESYTLVNTNIGFNFNRNLNISFNGTNIFNKRHKEFPLGDTLGRKITVKLTNRF